MTEFNTVIESDSFNDLYRKVNFEVVRNGIISKPRGIKIYELLNCSLILNNPRNRLLESKFRKHSYTYACGEFFWYLRASNSLEEMTFYLERMKEYSDDGVTLNSAYGHRIFGVHDDFPNQWANVVENLIGDPDSRQAVITINYPNDLINSSKDVPCTLNLQFLIRDNKLHLITRMRSNDSFMGLIYDVFCFTLFQEMMLNDLNYYFVENIEMGKYVHNAGSMHMYATDKSRVWNVLSETHSVNPQQEISNAALNMLCSYEKSMRLKKQLLKNKGKNTTYNWIVEKLNKKIIT